jgi:hypothetical protein
MARLRSQKGVARDAAQPFVQNRLVNVRGRLQAKNDLMNAEQLIERLQALEVEFGVDSAELVHPEVASCIDLLARSTPICVTSHIVSRPRFARSATAV